MARDVLLDYVLQAKAVEPVQPASRAYLHNVLVIAKLKDAKQAGIYECTTKATVQEYTDSQCYALFDAGMTKIYLCAVANYADAQALIDANTDYKYFTILTDPAFTDVPTAITGFAGVAGWSTETEADAKTYQAISTANNTAFLDATANAGLNMYHAFGTLLSAAQWRNQQYIAMPATGITANLGKAVSYFEERLSFVLQSEEYGNRLAFFVNRGRAIVAPYIYEEFTLDLKSWALQYISVNMPDYNDVEAAKLQSFLIKKANAKYISTGLVTAIKIAIKADQDNFIMSGDIAIAEPKATWRITAQVQQGGLE